MARPIASVNPPATRRALPGHRAVRAALLALVLAAPLGGCALFGAPEEVRGNRADPDLLKEITPNVSSRADVSALLGSPSATSTFDQSEWYYISATSHIRPGRVPGMENQRVVVVSFDDRGIVRGVRELGESDMRNVAVVERTTPVPGNERSLLQALFGNIGRFGPATTQPDAPGPSAPSP
jgi:outer membrane protein assembly factor BamE (lipoprotein component of BamABCDE complex)